MRLGLRAFPLTREHGAWAMFLVPLLAGIIVADAVSVKTAVFGFGSLAIFLAHHPLESAFGAGARASGRRSLLSWDVALLLAGTLPVAFLVARGDFFLAPIGLLAALAALVRLWIVRRSGRGLGSDVIGVAGLCLGAPAAYALGSGSLDRAALLSWLACFLFFGSTVFYVHMKIAALKSKDALIPLPRRISLGRLNLMYHAVVVAILVGSTLLVHTPAAMLAVYGPMVTHAIWGTFRLTGNVRLKRLGILLVGQSIAFLVLLATLGREGLSP